MSAPLLQLQGVHTHIGAYHILHGVDLTVTQGQLTLLLGRNGAGKTTTLRTIMGLWRASSGQVIYQGRDITSTPTPDIARLSLAYVPENMGIFPDLKVCENILLAARSARHLGAIDGDRLEQPGLAEGLAGREGLRRFARGHVDDQAAAQPRHSVIGQQRPAEHQDVPVLLEIGEMRVLDPRADGARFRTRDVALVDDVEHARHPL